MLLHAGPLLVKVDLDPCAVLVYPTVENSSPILVILCISLCAVDKRFVGWSRSLFGPTGFGEYWFSLICCGVLWAPRAWYGFGLWLIVEVGTKEARMGNFDADPVAAYPGRAGGSQWAWNLDRRRRPGCDAGVTKPTAILSTSGFL